VVDVEFGKEHGNPRGNGGVLLRLWKKRANLSIACEIPGE
jgi:hypothetical protein